MAFDGLWRFWWQMFSIKAVKFHQTHQKLLMAFDGFWRFWWQIFSIKAVKPHQRFFGRRDCSTKFINPHQNLFL